MKLVNEPTIIDHGPIIVADGLVPHRAVLRHVPENVMQWISHWEQVAFIGEEVVHRSFFDGNYFDDEKDARKDFERRVIRFNSNRYTRALERDRARATELLRLLKNAVEDANVGDELPARLLEDVTLALSELED